jgi:hypothetical protein
MQQQGFYAYAPRSYSSSSSAGSSSATGAGGGPASVGPPPQWAPAGWPSSLPAANMPAAGAEAAAAPPPLPPPQPVWGGQMAQAGPAQPQPQQLGAGTHSSSDGGDPMGDPLGDPMGDLDTMSMHGLTTRQYLAPPPWQAMATVSPLLACIGSPCLRHCVHGASIGIVDGVVAARGRRRCGGVCDRAAGRARRVGRPWLRPCHRGTAAVSGRPIQLSVHVVARW